jgi:copper-(or silver)-translocating P-type ATPase/heavy metal-(Cd/Co/Hg/Pb/Zn)-translocating P-type ATPase
MVALGAVLIISSYLFKQYNPESLSGSLFALIAVLILGGPIVWNAAKGLLELQTNVDELVSLAIVASVFIGEYQAAAVVAFIMVLGSLLEKFTSERARSAIHSLIRLNPDQATLIIDEEEIPVPIKDVKQGDLVLIRPGERIPVDGLIVRGEAAVNQSSLTGESMPVDKKPGDQVYAGTIIYNGMLVVEVERAGAESTLGRLIKLVQDAENVKAPILRVADRYAKYFTHTIIGLSILVFLVTKDISRAVTLLIVGCPCAFILAAPTAVTASLGNAARHGVLIKGGALLEEMGRINAVLFDKTGTLTTGEPVVAKIMPLAPYNEENLLTLAASAERYSEHPIARAILKTAQEAGCILSEPVNFRQIVGKGIEAMVAGKLVFVGAVSEGDPAYEKISNEDHWGTILMVKQSEQIIGYLAVSDQIRADVRVVIDTLGQIGIKKIALLTGDGFAAASGIAKEAGIEEFYITLLPEQKLEYIRGLQQQNYKVAMVGDGINDAPSLAAADIGIAMGAMGTDVALDAADIALMNDELDKIPFSLKLGRATLNTINFNIAFAMVFNSLAIIGSGLGYLHPISGAIVHNIGSVFVVINSALLLRRRFPI